MNARAHQKWDLISIAGILLCLGPIVASFIRVGLPNDWALWEWFVILPIAAALLGAPQLALLVFITKAEVPWLRLLFLGTSVTLLGIFSWFLARGDLTSSSTAGVGLMFLALYLAAGGFAFGLIVLWLYAQFQK